MTKELTSTRGILLYAITVTWLMVWTHSTVSSSSIGNQCLPHSCSQAVKLAGCKAFEANGKQPQSCLLLERDVCNEFRDNEDIQLPSFCPKFRMSCAEIHAAHPSLPSGIYNITLSNGTDQEVYCDMEGVNCDGEGGWTRIGYVNMTDPDVTCPSGLVQQDESSRQFCRGSVEGGCNGAFFKSLTIPYNKVCGRVIGYQFGSTLGFLNSFTDTSSIEANYLDGLSITHNGTMGRTHIWSYGAGLTEDTTVGIIGCPCNNGFNSGSGTGLAPFIGDDYYCESGTAMTTSQFLINDTLWDGEQCNGPEARCCPSDSKQPWFTKQLNQSTSDDVELRICTSSPSTGNVYIELIEIYIH